MKAPTKTQLQQALQEAGVSFKSKATKAELEKLLADSTKQTGKKPRGAKATLRDTFAQSGFVTTKDIKRIATTLKVQKATVLTALSDLQNPRYAGAAGPLAIQKDDDGTYRLTK